jgi:hypothetical protein
MEDMGSSLALSPLTIAWNPLAWTSMTYLVLIALILILRFFVPRSEGRRIRLAREVMLLLPAGLLYFAVRGLVDARDVDAIRNAERVIGVERSLGIFHELTLQQWIHHFDTLVTIMNWVYIWAHWPIVVGTLLWLILSRKQAYPQYRAAFLLSGVTGMVIFALFPVAPPRLMPDLTFIDTVTQRSHSYRVLQPTALTNPYAAMPSLHFGWNLLMGIAIARHATSRPGRAFGYAMPPMMFLSIILTGNHYFLDGVAGGALVLVSLWIVMAVIQPLNQARMARARQPGGTRPSPVTTDRYKETLDGNPSGRRAT